MSWLDSTWCAVFLYLLVLTLALVLGAVEHTRRRADANSFLWPTFWFATAALVFAMVLGRAADTGQLLADLGRDQARSQGWYQSRRSTQALVIAAIAGTWAIGVAVSIWRVPERRRRYLPTALTMFTVVCYAGVRIISLHQLDALLHNRNFNGVTYGAITELSLLVCTLGVAALQLRRSAESAPSHGLRAHM